ncbi:MAG: hypothetical protein WCO75_04715 [Planctomycetota bacterium]
MSRVVGMVNGFRNPCASLFLVTAVCAAITCGGMAATDDSTAVAKDGAAQKQASAPAAKQVDKQGDKLGAKSGGEPGEPRRGDAMRWRPDGPMPPEMIDRVIAVARDVSPELAAQLEERRTMAPDEMSQAMRQSARRLVALAVIKERNPNLYAIRVEDVRLQLELRTLGDAYRAAQEAGDASKAAALGVQIAAKVRAQVDIDLKARAQELIALDEQMKAMRDDLVQEQRGTDARVAERIDAVKKGQPIQERGMFGEGGSGGAGGERRGKSRPEQPAAANP